MIASPWAATKAQLFFTALKEKVYQTMGIEYQTRVANASVQQGAVPTAIEKSSSWVACMKLQCGYCTKSSWNFEDFEL